jgi:hypothetical protein
MRTLFHHIAHASLRVRVVTALMAVAVTLGAIGGLDHLADSQYSAAMKALADLDVPTFLVHISASKP